MTRDEFLDQHAAYCNQMIAIVAKKNADYTGNAGPFANFERVEALGIASTEVGFLTRMIDKLCRIHSFVQKGILQVKDENVEDTLLDLANYALILAAYIKNKKEQHGHLDQNTNG